MAAPNIPGFHLLKVKTGSARLRNQSGRTVTRPSPLQGRNPLASVEYQRKEAFITVEYAFASASFFEYDMDALLAETTLTSITADTGGEEEKFNAPYTAWRNWSYSVDLNDTPHGKLTWTLRSVEAKWKLVDYGA